MDWPYQYTPYIWPLRTGVGLTHKASGKQWPAGLNLWVTGTVSPLARKNLEVLGIKVTERVDQKIEFAD